MKYTCVLANKDTNQSVIKCVVADSLHHAICVLFGNNDDLATRMLKNANVGDKALSASTDILFLTIFPSSKAPKVGEVLT